MQECVGGAALQQCKSKIQSYSEQTSSALKKHVYANYMQFIETAKEISRMIHQFVCFSFSEKNVIYCFCFRSGIRNVSIVTFVN